MKIRLGGPAFITTHNREPANTGTSEIANREIDYQLATSNQAYENALKVDGVEFLLYRRVDEGRRCSCRHDDQNLIPANSAFQEFSGIPDNNTDSIKVRGSWDRQTQHNNIYGKELGIDIGRISPDDASNKQVVKNYPSVDQEEIDAFLNGPPDARLLESGEGTTACGICLGTGYTNGYSLYNGVRLTFDALNVKNISKFFLNRNKHPFIFSSNADNMDQYVEWSIELPLFTKALAIIVRNNLVPADQLAVKTLVDDSWIDLTLDYLNTTNTSSCTMHIRVLPKNPLTSNIEFTHVEIVLQQADFKFTQIGQLQKSRTFSTVEPITNTEFYLPPSISNVSENDVIVDSKYNKAWQVTDITDFMTSKNKIVNWTVSVRSLTSFDIPSLLKIVKLPNYEIAFNDLNEDS